MKPYSAISRFKHFVCIILFAVLLLVQTISVSAATDDERNLQYLRSIMEMIREQYKGELTDGKLIEGAVEGMLNSLDDYTTYYTPDEMVSFSESVTGIFGGIGISMEISGDYIIVSKVFPASPAEKAGILQGDKIVEAGGISLVGAAAEEAAAIIKGKAGTKVTLGILRNGNKIMYFDIIREIIKINPVTYEIRDDIGYIKLEMFNENTDEYISLALEEMDRNNIKKIVLDLRDNPGGEVSQAVAVAQKFVPEGLITTLDYKSERYTDIEYYSNLKKPKYKLAVLVNGMSASASEIVAGAIQDTGAGKLVGAKTFGKAKFQGFLPLLSAEAFSKYNRMYGVEVVNGYDLQLYYGITPLPDEIIGYTKMTLGLYYTPSGRMIDGTGLTPDIQAEDPKPVSDVYINSIQRLSKTTKPGFRDQGTDVYNAEKLLKAMGYTVDIPDTILDARSVVALKEYQRASGLKASGILDYETQDALNASILTLIYKYDKQYNAAAQVLKQ